MQTKHIINVRQGVWIDKRWLQKAGLGSRLQVEMKTGEIRIQTASKANKDIEPTEKGRSIFQTLGDNAADGCMKNAAQNHDRYLYGKRS
jgi:hypothetical protein